MTAPARPKRTPRKPPNADIRNVIGDTPNPPTPPTPEPENISDSKPKTSKPRSGSLEARLGEAFATVAILPAFVGDAYSSFIIASRSAAFCHNLAELAKVNPRVKRMLEGMLDGGVYGGVAFSGMAMLIPILSAYGIIPAMPVDPFAAFYPQLPEGITPRSRPRKARSSAGNRAVPTPGEKTPQRSPGGAPVSTSTPTPEGVVTVQPGMHPPGNPAAN